MKQAQGKIVTIYVLLMTVVFPLFMVHTYYDIQQVKMYLYLYSTIACLALVLLTAVVCAVRSQKERAALLESLRPSGIRQWIRKSDMFAAVLLIAVVVSTLTSEWLYEAFWGNNGRNQGGFMWFWYIVTYFLISRRYTYRQWHMDLFLLSGAVACGWCVLDFFSLSPIGTAYITLFSSTFGNIDVLSAGMAVFAGAASIMFIGEKWEDRGSRIRSVCYLLAVAVIYLGLICARTSNVALSALFLFCFIPFYAFRNRSGILRYLILLLVFLLGLLMVAWLISRFPDYACSPDFRGELASLAVKFPKWILAAAAALSVLLAALTAAFRAAEKREQGISPVSTKKDAEGKMQGGGSIKTVGNTEGKESKNGITTQTGSIRHPDSDDFGLTAADRRRARILRLIWGALGVTAAVLLVGIFVDANTGGHPELYAPASNILIFDEKWGTDRGYAWGLALKYFRSFSPLKKLFGSGPETFSIYVLIHDLNANLRRFDYYYDSIHNEWLQQLFETGLVGFLSYYGLNLSCCMEGIRGALKKDGTAETAAVAYTYALAAYLLQSFVNIRVPIALPLAIVCMSLAAAVGRTDT